MKKGMKLTKTEPVSKRVTFSVSANPSDKVFLAGYLPWAYWGYSVLFKGAGAEAMTKEILTGAALGPGAVPKLVAATPRLPVERRLNLFLPWTSTLVILILSGAAWWFWRSNRGS